MPCIHAPSLLICLPSARKTLKIALIVSKSYSRREPAVNGDVLDQAHGEPSDAQDEGAAPDEDAPVVAEVNLVLDKGVGGGGGRHRAKKLRIANCELRI